MSQPYIPSALCDADCVPRGSRHRCHAEGCERRIPATKIACPRHWNAAGEQYRKALKQERKATIILDEVSP